VRTANSGGDTYWRLLDPFGRPVWGPTGIGSDVDVTLTYAGTYTLLVEGRYYVGGTASYSFNVLKVSDDTAATSLNTPTSGSIGQPGQRDNFTFTLAAAKRIAFDGQTTNTSMFWSLRGPRGVVVDSRRFYNTDSADGTSIFDLVAGDYTVTIDADSDVTGAYGFALLDLATATALATASGLPAVGSTTTRVELYNAAGACIASTNTAGTGAIGAAQESRVVSRC